MVRLGGTPGRLLGDRSMDVTSRRGGRPHSLLHPVSWLAVAGLALLALGSPGADRVLATGGPGAIWTTEAGCLVQNRNHYAVGEDVYLRGANFPAGASLAWTVTGQPGGASSDPGLVVASGAVTADPGGAFCLRVYTVQPGDRGEYTVDVVGAKKNDNFRVRGAAPTPPPTSPPTEPPADDAVLVVQKLIDLDGKAATADPADRRPTAGWRFDIAVAGGTPTTATGRTGADGRLSFAITPAVAVAVVDVEEQLPKGVTALQASCSGPGGSRGTASPGTGAVLDVRLAAGETVTCTFVNTSGTVSPATAKPAVTAPATSVPPSGGGSGSADWRVVVVALIGLIAMLELLVPSRLLRVLAR